jgi:hypothetical protein
MTSLARDQMPNVRINLFQYLTANVTSVVNWDSPRTKLRPGDSAVGRIEIFRMEPYSQETAEVYVPFRGEIAFDCVGSTVALATPTTNRRALAFDEAWRIVYDILDAIGRGANCGGYYFQWDGEIMIMPVEALQAENNEAFQVIVMLPFKLLIEVPLEANELKHLPLRI